MSIGYSKASINVAYYITNLGAQKLLQSDESIVVDEWYKYEEQCDIDLYHIRPIVAMGKQTK